MQRKLHINCLELLSRSFAVKSFIKERLCVHMHLCMDNVSAVAYINFLGDWALKRNMILSAERLSGALNVSADWESRHFLGSSNWELCPAVFLSLMRIRTFCKIDLFADRLNTQLPHFFSLRPDSMTLATDDLLQSWFEGRPNVFPPFCLIIRSLGK